MPPVRSIASWKASAGYLSAGVLAVGIAWPDVLLIEAMAQTGGILVLHDKEHPETYSTYFLHIDNVKFRQKVVPGDTLIFRVELVAPLRHSIGTMQGYAFIGENCVAEATFTAQVISNRETEAAQT